jgi:cytochrome c oxidase subunit 3
MMRAKAAELELAEVLPQPQPRFGGSPPPANRTPLVSNAKLALVLFIGTETMLFAALLGGFVVFRMASRVWPPTGQPYLPVAITWMNTAVLLTSAWTLHQGVRAVRAGGVRSLRTNLLVTVLLGMVFLLVQGFEWIRLIGHGLTLSSSTYGATFYVLIGFHGLHVLGAVVWLMVAYFLAGRGRYGREHHLGVELCSLYWYFVCALWVVLFGLVYLS